MSNIVSFQDYKNKKQLVQKPDSEMTLDERLARIASMINRINQTIKELDASVHGSKK